MQGIIRSPMHPSVHQAQGHYVGRGSAKRVFRCLSVQLRIVDFRLEVSRHTTLPWHPITIYACTTNLFALEIQRLPQKINDEVPPP